MILNFTFGNFKSFQEHATLSLIAASKLQVDNALSGNVFAVPQHSQLSLLHVAAIYGANASGKTNIVQALSTFQKTVTQSANNDFAPDGTPFFFRKSMSGLPTHFELTFLLDGAQYRYGFEINLTSPSAIAEEWLYRATSSRETVLFERTGEIVDKKRPFTEGTGLLKEKRLLRKDALFLSLCALAGGELSQRIVNYIKKQIRIISGLNDQNLRQFTTRCLENGRCTDLVTRLLQEGDTGISKVHLMEEEELAGQFPGLTEQFAAEEAGAKQHFVGTLRLQAEHTVYDAAGKPAGTSSLPMAIFESDGTQKLFAFAGPIADALEHGYAMVVDEMDAKWHPMMTSALVRLFQSPTSNPHHAQLIFVTHDTNLLDYCRFRRDQIWFVEKDSFGASRLYSLAEFKGVRKDAFEDDYIAGRYGAVPVLGDFTKLFGEAAGRTIADDVEALHHAKS